MSVDAPQRLSTRSLVLCACLAQVIVVLDTTIIAVALPDAQRELGFGDADRQWAITAYTLAFGSLLLVGGRISQVLGARRAFMLGVAGFGAVSLAGGFATSFGLLVAARVAQGVFAALMAPTNLSLMNTAFPGKDERAKAFAIFGAVAGAGAALGLVLGGALTQAGSWRWCFFVNVPLALVTVLLATRGLRGTSPARRGVVLEDAAGLLLGSSAVFCVVLGFSRAETLGWGHPLTVGLLGAGVLLGAGFLARERVAPSPLVPLSIVTDARRASSYLTIGLVGLAQMGSSLYLTFYLQRDLGYTPLRTGVAFLPMVGGLVVAAVVSTRVLVPRVGLAATFVTGAAVQAAGFAWIATRVDVTTTDAGPLVAPMVVAGIGLGLVMAPAMSSATHGIGPAHSSIASAFANTSQQLGASLGVAFLSTVAADAMTRTLTSGADELRAGIASAVAAAGAEPGSAQAAAIRDQLVAQAARSAEISAYSTGLTVLALICAGVALAVVAVFAADRRHGGRGSRTDDLVEATA